MASPLLQEISDLRTRILTVPGVTYCAIFNNQVKQEDVGKTFNFSKPAVLMELVSASEGVQLLGNGVTCHDPIWRFSIVHEELNAEHNGQAGTGMDENLNVFLLRDLLKISLTGFKPNACSHLQYLEESLDYDHDNIYVYGISFKCSFIDSKGSPYDPDSGAFITKQPPFALDLDTYYTTPAGPKTRIGYGWKACTIQVQIVETPDPEQTQQLGNGDIIPIQYALNGDGTLTIPELISYPGITVLTPFLIDGNNVMGITYDNLTGTFDPASTIGSFQVDNEIELNATLPLYTSA